MRRAEEQLRKPRLLTWHSVAGLLFVAIMGAEGGWIFAAYYLGFFLAMLALQHWWARRQLREFLTGLPREFKPVGRKEPAIPEFYRVLQSLPRPRRVRLKKEGRRQLLIYVGLFLQVVPFVFFASRSNPDFRGLQGALRLLFLLHVAAGYAVLFWEALQGIWREARNWGLLMAGEIALATVASQEGAKFLWISASKIAYDFRDGANRPFRGNGVDLTGQLFEEMLVPVLYDIHEPARNVAIACTYFEVLVPRAGQVPMLNVVRPEGMGSSWLQAIRAWIDGGRRGSSA